MRKTCMINFMSLKKETEAIRRWKDPPCLWVSRINIEKMPINPQIQCNPLQNSKTILDRPW